MNWNDLRHVLAISRAGTLSGAAHLLGVNQTTVTRRLQALETDLDVRLFDRIDGRMVATKAGGAVLDRAARLEQEIHAIERTAAGLDAMLAGVVRVASVEGLFVSYLVPRLGGFRRRFPNIRIEAVAGSQNINLTRREADMALRLARPSQGAYMARKLANIGFAVYAGHAVTGAADWLGYDDSLAQTPESRWLRTHAPDAQPVLTTNSIPMLANAARAGLGRAVLPCYVGDPEPDLARISGPEPVIRREVWMLTHPDLRSSARVNALSDWLVDRFATDRALLLGSPA